MKLVTLPLLIFLKGFAVLALVSALRHISGGNLNPAVTTALVFSGKMPILRAAVYIFVQCCGAIVGAGILKGAIANSGMPFTHAHAHSTHSQTFMCTAPVYKKLLVCENPLTLCGGWF